MPDADDDIRPSVSQAKAAGMPRTGWPIMLLVVCNARNLDQVLSSAEWSEWIGSSAAVLLYNLCPKPCVDG